MTPPVATDANCTSKAASGGAVTAAANQKVFCHLTRYRRGGSSAAAEFVCVSVGSEDVVGGDGRADDVRVQSELLLGCAAGGRRHGVTSQL